MSDKKMEQLLYHRLTRRDFLKYSALTGAGVAFGSQALAQGTAGGSFNWLVHHEVAGLSPNFSGATIQLVIITNILDPLFIVNHATETEPVLATDWSVSADGLTFTINLKQGVIFHNGDRFTAADVKYTYEYYAQPGNTIAGRFTNMDSVEVVDDHTVRVHMKRVDASFIRVAGQTGIVNAAYHAAVGEDRFAAEPIGTGAFTVATWNPASFTELVAFNAHHRGAPQISRIRFEVVPEPSVRYIALLTGDADSSVWPISTEDALDLEKDPNFVVFRTPSNSPRMIFLNNTHPALSDRELRRAMLRAVDRQRIIDDLESGLGVIATSHLAPHNAQYYNPNVPEYPYDPEAAKAQLDAAGWVPGSDGVRVKNGVRASFTCTTLSGDATRRPMAELTQIFLREVGVEMLLAEAPLATVQQGLLDGSIDASLFNWTMGTVVDPNPQATLSSNGGNNYNRYRNEEMDRLIVEGVAVVDPALRKPIYDRTQELFAQDVPCLILHYNLSMSVFANTIKGLPENVLTSDPLWFRGHEYSRG
jgi:peptide/nickel transport system substrate-binding protein